MKKRIILKSTPMEVPMRPLYRSSSNRMFSGVCGGLGEYWGIDPVILRLLWTFITVFTGLVPGVVVYIFAVFIIPMKPLETPIVPPQAAHH